MILLNKFLHCNYATLDCSKEYIDLKYGNVNVSTDYHDLMLDTYKIDISFIPTTSGHTTWKRNSGPYGNIVRNFDRTIASDTYFVCKNGRYSIQQYNEKRRHINSVIYLVGLFLVPIAAILFKKVR